MDKEPKYIDGVGWRYETEHSMHRRLHGHDYQGRCIYMLTLTLADRRQHLLGELRWKEGREQSQEQSREQSQEAELPGTGQADTGQAGTGQADTGQAGAGQASGVQGSSAALLDDRQAVDGRQAVHRRAAGDAELVPTVLGRAVADEWWALCREYPQVSIIRLQLMPEHLHVVVFVRDTLPKPLGKLVGIVKNRCNKHYWQALTLQGLLAPKGEQTPPPLFSDGYQDSVLTHDGQLDAMVNYVEQNPYRALMKSSHPDLFRVVRDVTVGGRTFAAIGNLWLLDRPVRLQVRCHNNTTPENLQLIERQKEYFLNRGRTEGAVIISPCISAGEKEIARAALAASVPLVVILENGFPPMYKPPGRYFEACCDGLLLMLAPWPYHMEQRKITRQQCLQLNDMAYAMCSEPWTKEMESKLSTSPQ